MTGFISAQVFDQSAHGRRGNGNIASAQSQTVDHAHAIDGHLPSLGGFALLADATECALFIRAMATTTVGKNQVVSRAIVRMGRNRKNAEEP